MPGTEAVMLEAIRRFHANEPADELFAPGYRRTGEALPFMPATGTAEERAAAMHAAAEVRWSEEVETRGEHALASAVWHHRGPRGGSAGRFWAVFRIRDGLIVEVHYAQDRAAARSLLPA